MTRNEYGDTTGTPVAGTGISPGRKQATLAVEANAPRRLLGIQAASEYLGVSRFTLFDLVNAGRLKKVELDLGHRSVRRWLVDRTDLDRLIEASKV